MGSYEWLIIIKLPRFYPLPKLFKLVKAQKKKYLMSTTNDKNRKSWSRNISLNDLNVKYDNSYCHLNNKNIYLFNNTDPRSKIFSQYNCDNQEIK